MLITLALLASAFAGPTAAPASPIVIAHRGASGLRPEHTLAAYRLAIAQGADFIEADAVMTRDGVLVARHENEIGGTTDVAAHPEFAGRRTTKSIDGTSVTGWFTEDFTLAELKTLRARERLPELRAESRRHDGEEPLPTLQEVIDLVRAESKARGREIGLYIETKHPSYHRGLGLAMDEALVSLLERNRLSRKDAPLFIESFEVGNLQRLHSLTEVRLIQLVNDSGHPPDRPTGETYAAMVTPTGLAAVARYAAGIGPAKALIVPRDAAGRSGAPTGLVGEAHRAGLLVHPWTFRSENAFLPAEDRRGTAPAAHGDAQAEVRRFLELGVDGVFSDFPGDAVEARRNPVKPDKN